MRNGMGSWTFVFAFFGFMALWIAANSLLSHPFDKFPFIALNLLLSTLAGVQAAALLIAAKRQDHISAELAENDYQANLESLSIVKELHTLTQAVEELTRRINGRVEDIHDAVVPFGSPVDPDAQQHPDPTIEGDSDGYPSDRP